MLKQIFKVCFSLVLFFTIFSCSSKDNYIVSKNKVGQLNSSTTMLDIDNLFKNDSVVKHLSEGILGYKGRYSQEDDRILIYSKATRNHLLTIVPKEPLDSLSTIKYVDIHDGVYVTEEGIGKNSTFSEINMLAQITKTEATFTKVVLYIDALNATMTLNKTELGIKTIQTGDVQLEQIPNMVKPQSFVVWFD